MEPRKLAEIAWADTHRTADRNDPEAVKKFLANVKYYSVVRKTEEYVLEWLRSNARDKDVFEMACGNGCYGVKVADIARSVTAADIAPISIQQAKDRAKGDPALEKINYQLLDCENTGLPENSFDLICEGGALHHMDLKAAVEETVRLLRPGGKFFCVEAIRHNPLIHMYRKLTPHLRTEWEADHILGKGEIDFVASYFETIELRLFNLTTLLAVPLRKTPIFSTALGAFEAIDDFLMSIPGLRWMAWQAVFVLSNPKKDLLKPSHLN